MIISLGQQLPAASSGGAGGAAEPLQIPPTQFLLASPRVCQPWILANPQPRYSEAFHPLAGYVSVALVRTRLYRIYDGQVGITH